MLYAMVQVVLEVLAAVLAGACLLRLVMQWQRIGFQQPLGRFVMAVTDWLVLPLRRVLPALGRLDTASLVAAWLIKLAQLTLLWSLLGAPGSALALLPASMLALAQLAVSALSALVLIYALMSWLQPGSDLYYTLGRLCEPWLAPVRRVLPLIGGVDLSPLVLLVVLQLVGMVLASGLRGLPF